MKNLLFPTLIGTWGYIDFGREALLEQATNSLVPENNPFLDPDYCKDWVRQLHKRDGIDFSSGGYLEDRSFLWRGHYMKHGHMWHLGTDYNVPAGTPVALPCPGVLLSSKVDPDQNGGWGGKLIFLLKRERVWRCMIFGHLDKIVNEVREYKAGEIIGEVAEKEKNGNWFPHLHIQSVGSNKNPELVDGYGPIYAEIGIDFPRPELGFE